MTESAQLVPGLDHGTPPSALLRQQEQVDALLRADEEPPRNGNQAGRNEAPELSVPAAHYPRAPFSRVERTPSAKTRVTLRFAPEKPMPGVPKMKFSFDVIEVSVKPCYISLWLAGDLDFELTEAARFILTFQDQEHAVVFAGCEFEFTGVPMKGVSFIREQRDDQERQS